MSDYQRNTRLSILTQAVRNLPHTVTTRAAFVRWLVDEGLMPADAATSHEEFSAEELDRLLAAAREGREVVVDVRISVPEERFGASETAVRPGNAAQRWRDAFKPAGTSYLNPKRTQVMLQGLQELAQTTVRFNRETGIVHTLQGDLLPDVTHVGQAAQVEAAQRFAYQHETALLGAEGYEWQRIETNPAVPNVVRLYQTDEDGIAVYGGTMTFGFDQNGRLTYLNNGCQPVPPDAGFAHRFELSWEEGRERARAFVARHLDRSGDGLQVLAEDPAQQRLVFPWREAGDPQEQYLAAWAVEVVHQESGLQWQVIVDAENESRNHPLALAPRFSHAPLSICVYLDNAQAIASQKKRVQLTDIDEAVLAVPQAFTINVAQFTLPTVENDPCAASVTPAFQAANVYYHLYKAVGVFDLIAAHAWPQHDLALLPGKVVPLPVTIDDGQPTAFKHSTGGINMNPTPPGGIEDNTLDCQVIYHEYTHAVLARVQRDLHDFITNFRFNRVLDEGFAFYFGVALSHYDSDLVPVNLRWAEFSYAADQWKWHHELKHLDDQRAEYDYLCVYGAFPLYEDGSSYPGSSLTTAYACAFLWARTLWDVREMLGGLLADAIILRSLSLLGGGQSDLETAAEAIIHVDAEYAAEQGTLSHENGLRLIFSSRGIMADTPIHTLLTVSLNGETYVLAATEGLSDDEPGCLISGDQGISWFRLGRGALENVVALTAVVEADRVILWAASEAFVDGNFLGAASPQQVLISKVYRYELEIVNGVIDRSKSWQELPDLPANPTPPHVLSLAAAQKGNGNGEWLFAGTEQGLYRLDGGQWQEATSILTNKSVFELAFDDSQPPRLMAAAYQRARIFDGPETMSQESNRSTQYALTALARSGAGFWVGTANDSVYFCQHTDGAWVWQPLEQIGEGGRKRPVYSLLATAVDAASTQWTLYAGTNNGVYRRQANGTWEMWNTVMSAQGDSLTGITVTALCQVGDTFLAATAERGLWARTEAMGWRRVVGDTSQPDGVNVSRIGRLIDQTIGPRGWSHAFSQHLKQHGSATHVLYLSHDQCDQLSFTLTAGDVAVKVFYVTPYTDAAEGKWAGLQARSHDVTADQLQPGFYVLAVQAEETETDYTVTVTLT